MPGFRNPADFNVSVITLDIVNGLDGTDNRGNPKKLTAQLVIKAIFYKKPRINKVTQMLDNVQNFEPFEGNVIEPKISTASVQDALISRARRDITGVANINGVPCKVRLISIGRGYLEAYNRQMGRVIQVEVIGGMQNV
jgi:hypothetical protein